MKSKLFRNLMLLASILVCWTIPHRGLSTSFSADNLNYNIISAEELTVEVTGGSGVSGDLVIPASVIYNEMTYRVLSVGRNAFSGNDNITSISFEEGIERIGYNAFDQCHHVRSIYIPASISSLYPNNDNPFSVEDDLESIIVASGNPIYDSRGDCNAIIESATSRMIAGCKTTIMPASLKSIAYDTFQNAAGMTEVTIAEGVTWIENDAFANCNDLVVVYSKSPIASPISSNAFGVSYSRAELRVPIGSKASYETTEGWSRFSSIVEVEDGGTMAYADGELQPDGTTTWTTFQGVKMTFKVIDAEKKWVQVGNGVDPSISQATTGEVTIPNEIVIDGETYTVVGIGDYGFYNCDKLTAIWLPENLQFIGKYAFYGCKLVGKIQIPETVYAIDDTAFEGCTGLTEISCPYIPGFSYPSVPNLIIIGYKPSDEDCDVVIPQPVTSIGERAFSYCATIRTMRVEEGNTVFDSRVNCNAIIRTADNVLLFGCKGTVIPSSVTAIDAYAFEGHTGLTTIAIPASVASIGQGAFADCTGLTSVTSNIQNPYAINDNTFSTTTYETATLYVPHGTKSAYQAADGWKNFLNIVELEDGGDTKPSTYTDSQGVNYQLINNGTAYKVTGHTDDFNLNLIIPAELFGLPVIEIGTFAFQYSALQSIVIPEGLTTIGRNAFHGCDLSSIHIPASVTSLYPETDNCFSANPSLNSITVAEGNSVYDSRDNCNAIIETSSNRLLTGCLGTIIPTSIPTIANDAFYGASFASVTIPANIQSIGAISFGSCNELISFKVLSETPFSIDSRIFDESEHNVFEYATLYVPKGSKTLYEQANVWRNFQNIVEFEDGGSTEPEDGVLQPDGTTTWTTFQGVKMTFKVIDAEKKWVQVGNGVDPSISQATTGEVTIPNEIVIDGETYTVVGIGDYGFYNCDKLTAIWLPDNLQFIGKYAFYGCKLVGKIQIPETVYAIDDTAFEGCTGLTEISCPYIPGYSYPSVPDLIIIGYKPSDEDYDVVIPQPVTSIGERAFSYCATIRTMRVEEGNTVFDSRDNCNAIIRTADNVLLFGCKSTVIPSSVTAIDAYAFEGHTGLTTIAIPASVASIGQGAFADCTGLTTVTSNIQSPYAINDNTFSTTTYETATLKVPHGTKSAYQAADGWKNFLNIVEMEEVVSDDPIIFADAEVKRICVENWDTNGDGELSYSEAAAVTELGTVFKDNNVITSFDELQYFIGLVEIGETAFSGCSEMTSIVLPQQITSIGSSAFLWCSELASIRIPKNVTNIESSFIYCRSLSSIIVESGNTKFDSRDNCNAIIETATNALLAGCMNTIIPDGVKYIRKFAFDGHSGLKTINIPSSIKSIDYTAFRDCGLDYITVDSDNTTYDSRDNCNAVIDKYSNRLIVGSNNTIIPNSVTVIGSEAFHGREQLNLSTLPDNVTAIENGAFYRCIGIESMELPNSVTSIGYAAFEACLNMKSVVLPSSITSISDRAFGQSRMNSLTIKLVEPLPIAANTFENRSRTTLYVPKGSKSAYENAEYWNEFKNIVELEDESNEDVLASGQCGDNLTYTIYSDYSMVISGTGEMWSYDYSCITPDFKDLVQELTIEEGVTSIGAFAFAQFTGINSLSIPNSVTTIGKFSFGYCVSVTSVNLGNGVTLIGNYAFSDCSSLVSLSIPDNVTIIGDYAFAGCSNVTSLTIGSGLRSFGDYAFDSRNLSSIIVDERNERFDSRDNCNALISLYNGLLLGCKNTIIPDGVVSIESHAFDGCTGLTSITIPNSVSSICSYAFAGCTGLTSLVIPNSVTSIGASAFYGCTGLTSITSERVAPARTEYGEIFEDIDKSACILYVPSGSKSIYENADYWKAFENIVEYGEERVVLAMGECGDNVRYVIYEDMTMLIVGVGEMWWYGSDSHINDEYYQSIQKVVVDEGVTEIGGGAFRGCTNLSSVTLSNSVTTINDGSFSDCTSLNLVSFGNNVTTIDGAFIGCTGLSTITIPNSVKTINGAFYGCTGLSSVTIGNNVETIGLRTFRDCTSLTSLAIPNSVITIDTEAFYNCTALTDISFGNGLKTIGRQAFQNCGLTSLFIPKSVSSITSGYLRDAFTCCSGLSSIVVESGNEIYDSRDNCNAIIETSTNKLIVGSNNTIIPTSVTTIGGWAFHYRFGLTEIVIPDNVTEIETEAFYNCKNLASVTLPNGITRIEFGTFDSYNKLTSITIPKSVISIGAHAFQCSQYLSTITVESSTPATIEAETTFSWVNKSTCTLYVPYGSKSAYENAEYWNEFENIVEIDDDPDTDISEYDNIVYIEGTEAVVGQRVRLSLNMNNTIVPTAFQCDVYLPDGVTAAWELDEDGNRSYLMGVNEGRTTTQRHALQGAEQPDGCLRILCNSVMNYSISGNEGEVAYLMVDIDPDMEEGTYPLILRNIEVTDANLNAVIVDYVKTSLTIVTHAPGDANGDSRVSVSDLTAIANHILGRTYASFDEKAADVNVDGRISVSDLTGVANIILYGTVSPHASNAKERGDSELVNVNIDANDVSATMGEEFTAAVNISGNYAYSGYQFDVTLPEGITVKDVGGQTTGSDLFMSGMIDDNTLRVLCASTTGETTESSVVYLTLVAESAGPYSIDIDNAIVSANASSFAIYESSFLVDIDSNATGISTLSDEAAGNASVYDLTGKMWNGDMSKLPKGIYIINGNKFSK